MRNSWEKDKGIIRKTDGALTVRAPEQPFPWWGPFNGIDAIGRAVLLIGLSNLVYALANFVFIRSQMGQRGSSFPLGDYYWIYFTLHLLGAVSRIPAGAGILLRKSWGVRILKLALYYSVIDFLCIPVYMAVRYGGFFNFPTILTHAFLIYTFLFPLWRWLRLPSTRYGFEHVSVNELEMTQEAGGILFGSTVARIGLWMVLQSSAYLFSILNFYRSNRIISFWSIMYITGFFLGIFVIVSGIMYKRKKRGRRTRLQIYAFMILGMLAAVAVYMLATFNLSPYNLGMMGIETITMISARVFYLLGVGYVVFEAIRYLRSGAAKAFCRAGWHVPDWKEQIRAAVTMEEALRKEPPAAPGENSEKQD
ncbi:MAG: hypothetical protein ACYS8W_14025 [Planctomycetota bacterium]|jgi:hypothetical protein